MLLFSGGESPHSFHSYLFSARSFKMQWIQWYMRQIGLYPPEGDTGSLLVGMFVVWLTLYTVSLVLIMTLGDGHNEHQFMDEDMEAQSS